MTKKKPFSCLASGLAAGLAVGAAAVGLYAFVVRPWHLRWGAEDDEVQRGFPGDEFIPNPKLNTTHAVSIQASPSQVWPWLVQIGQGRGGFYSYDWLENMAGLGIHSANQILPEHQDLKVGDGIPLSPDGFDFPVAILEPEQALVLYGDTRQDAFAEEAVMKPGDYMTATWGFYLQEQPGGATRLVERWRADWNESPLNTVFYRAFLEPGAFLMQRKMLLGIKERAESAS